MGLPDILIVEDDIDTSELYIEALALLKLNTKAVTNLGDALDFLVTKPHPRAIVLDLNVPGLPAADFHRQLLELLDPQQTKLILVSGSHTLTQKATELRAWSFLSKPFELNDFLALFQRLADEVKSLPVVAP